MTTEQVWLAAACALATAVALVALLLAARALRRAARSEAHAAVLAERIAVLESPTPDSPVADDEVGTFVITHLGSDAPRETAVAHPIDGRLFADIVARETVVKAASWTHGLRRALSAESRNRIRFQVRQETRRAGRERKAELKQALREHRARERDAFGSGVGEDVA